MEAKKGKSLAPQEGLILRLLLALRSNLVPRVLSYTPYGARADRREVDRRLDLT